MSEATAVGLWILVGVAGAVVLGFLAGWVLLAVAWCEDLSIAFVVDRDDGGGDMEIGTLAVEIGGAAARVRLVGKTAAGRRAALEAITAAVSQNPERFAAVVEGDVVAVVAVPLPGEEVVPAPGDSSLAGTLAVTADGRLGEGVRHLEATLGLVAVAPDAVAIVFEPVEVMAPAAEELTPPAAEGNDVELL